MSDDLDKDIQSLLNDVLDGKDPEFAELDTPTPPSAIKAEAPPEPEFTRRVNEDEEESDDSIPAEVTAKAEGGAVTVEEILDAEASDEEVADLPPIDESVFAVTKADPVLVPTFTTEEIMKEVDIRNFGMLASLSTQRWHAKTRDRKAALDASAASGADASAFEARKRLLVGADEKLKRVHKAIDAARTAHYKMTLPWSTVGINDQGKRAGRRLLPNTLYFEYVKEMAGHKNEMTTALDDFVQAYPTLIAIAQQKLGSSFSPSDYPAPSAIRSFFGMTFDFDPIPKGGDFDGVQVAQVEKLQAAMEKKTMRMLENAMQDAWKRLYDDLKHAAETLADSNAAFHNTLIEKLRIHASMLKHLNATKDERIEDVRRAVEDRLCKRDAKDVRKDDALRRELAEHAKAIFADMEGYVT